LTSSDVLVENRLFATLDSTVRQFHMRDHKFLLTDTVGFVRKLPHHLVASFRSTLEEAREADVLLHVVDITSPALGDQIAAVNDVLQQLDVTDKPTIYVVNKVDLLEEGTNPWQHIPEDTPYVEISAKTGQNIEMLEEMILEIFADQFQETTIVLPLKASRFVSMAYDLGEVRSEEYLEGNRVKLVCYAPQKDIERFRKAWKDHANARPEYADV
jgi:GTP-binding protein HflX